MYRKKVFNEKRLFSVRKAILFYVCHEMLWNVMKCYAKLWKAKKGFKEPRKAMKCHERLRKAIQGYAIKVIICMLCMLWKVYEKLCYVMKWYVMISKDMQCGPMYAMISFAWKKMIFIIW